MWWLKIVPWAREKEKLFIISFTKTAITFEPLELQCRDTTHFKALDELFLTVSNTKGFKLQGRIRKLLKVAIANYWGLSKRCFGIKEKTKTVGQSQVKATWKSVLAFSVVCFVLKDGEAHHIVVRCWPLTGEVVSSIFSSFFLFSSSMEPKEMKGSEIVCQLAVNTGEKNWSRSRSRVTICCGAYKIFPIIKHLILLM